jgi:hypothetical protein
LPPFYSENHDTSPCRAEVRADRHAPSAEYTRNSPADRPRINVLGTGVVL